MVTTLEANDYDALADPVICSGEFTPFSTPVGHHHACEDCLSTKTAVDILQQNPARTRMKPGRNVQSPKPHDPFLGAT